MHYDTGTMRPDPCETNNPIDSPTTGSIDECSRKTRRRSRPENDQSCWNNGEEDTTTTGIVCAPSRQASLRRRWLCAFSTVDCWHRLLLLLLFIVVRQPQPQPLPNQRRRQPATMEDGKKKAKNSRTRNTYLRRIYQVVFPTRQVTYRYSTTGNGHDVVVMYSRSSTDVPYFKYVV